MTDLIVRPPVAGDRAGWEALFRAYATFYEVPMTAGTLETVWGWIHDPAHLVDALVAERGGTLVGLAHYRAMPSPLRGATLGFLDDLFVEPAARGTKVGEELLAHLAGIAAERGWRCVRRSTPSQKKPLASTEASTHDCHLDCRCAADNALYRRARAPEIACSADVPLDPEVATTEPLLMFVRTRRRFIDW